MAGRRGNLEGTIRKRTRKRADGSVFVWYEGSIMVGRRADGRPDRRTVTGATREEVRAKLAELVAQRHRGEIVPADDGTVRAYLENWLEHHKRFGGPDGKGIRPKTASVYSALLKYHILPRIGRIPLQKLTPDHLKALYQAMVTQPGPKKRPVSIRVAEQAHNLLHKAFADAVREGKLLVNPCDRVANPPRTRYRAKDRPWLEQEQVPKVLAVLANTRYYLPILVAMATGLRRNEVLGLTWECIDFEEGLVHVRHQWGRRQDGSWGLVPPKTTHSIRSVPLPRDVADALSAHLVTEKARLGNRWSPKALVFDRGDGTPILPTDLTHAWARARKAAGLDPRIRLHDLRGSYLTWLAERGVDVKTAAELAGHADIKMTAEIYQRVSRRMLRRAARAVEGLTRLRAKK